MSTIQAARAGAFLIAVLAAGCSDGSSAPVGTPPPHGGHMIMLPDDAGFVEVVKKKNDTPEVAFYFYKTMTTPISPAPAKGTLKVTKKKSVELTQQGDALVTPVGPPLFKEDGVDGFLVVELDGKTKSVPLGIR